MSVEVDFFYHYSIQTIWIVLFIYWRLAARDAKMNVRTAPTPLRLLHWSLLIAGASLFTIVPPGAPWLWERMWPQSVFAFFLGLLVMLIGFACAVWARVTLGRNWSNDVAVKVNHELIVSGPYAWARHPIYTGLLLMFLGTGIAIGEWRGLVTMALVLTSFYIKASYEEKYMVEIFGAQYEAYRKRVKMLIPFVW